MRPNKDIRNTPVSRLSGRAKRRPRGATLVEVLIAVSIAATLLVAVAVALDASMKSYQVNQEQSNLTQRTRMGMHRLLSAVRAGASHMPYGDDAEADFRAGIMVTDTGIKFESSDGVSTVYRYDAATARVLADVGGASNVLLEGVEEFQITMEPMKSASHVKAGLDHDLMRRATILLTLRAASESHLPGGAKGENTMTISSSVMPRRNAW